MHPHLHPPVDAEVELGVLISTAAVARLKACHLHRERLLVELSGLHLTGILNTGHVGWEHIVHRFLSGVLLDINYRHVELTLGGRVIAAIEIEFIVAPLPSHKFERAKAQVGSLLEAGHEDACESYGGEI